MAPKLILTGFMATGKSVDAKACAEILGWRLIDCDAMIVARAGMPIAEIFREQGEACFRKLERELIAELAGESLRCPQSGRPLPAVIATGGGALVDSRNFDALSRIGVIVCLTARPEVIARRIGAAAASRPMLTQGGKPLNDRIAELIEARREAYARAHLAVDTSDLTIDETAAAIIDAFGRHGRKSWATST